MSADYIGYVEKTIRGLMGEKAGFVFLNGMSGDITQVDNGSPFKLKEFGEISARFIGGSVAAEALKVLLATEQSAGSQMPVAAVTGKTLKNRRRVPSANAYGVAGSWPQKRSQNGRRQRVDVC